MDVALKVHDVDDWLHPTAFYKEANDLTKKGYSVDFVSDKLIASAKISNGLIQTNENARPYQTLIIPKSNLMSIETLNHIINLAKNGANIIFQELPNDVPGLNNLENRRAEFKSIINDLKFTKE